jgi:hypothetical protein
MDDKRLRTEILLGNKSHHDSTVEIERIQKDRLVVGPQQHQQQSSSSSSGGSSSSSSNSSASGTSSNNSHISSSGGRSSVGDTSRSDSYSSVNNSNNNNSTMINNNNASNSGVLRSNNVIQTDRDGSVLMHESSLSGGLPFSAGTGRPNTLPLRAMDDGAVGMSSKSESCGQGSNCASSGDGQRLMRPSRACPSPISSIVGNALNQ